MSDKKFPLLKDYIDRIRSRPNKCEYYMNIAKSVAMRSTCLRRKYGAIIVKDDEIISTGYNGSPRNCENCCEIGECVRNKLNIPGKERYELCKSVHAEMNCIISAKRSDMLNSTLYLYGLEPDGITTHDTTSCSLCKKMIINAGIKYVVSTRIDDSGNIYYDVLQTNKFIDDINNIK